MAVRYRLTFTTSVIRQIILATLGIIVFVLIKPVRSCYPFYLLIHLNGCYKFDTVASKE